MRQRKARSAPSTKPTRTTMIRWRAKNRWRPTMTRSMEGRDQPERKGLPTAAGKERMTWHESCHRHDSRNAQVDQQQAAARRRGRQSPGFRGAARASSADRPVAATARAKAARGYDHLAVRGEQVLAAKSAIRGQGSAAGESTVADTSAVVSKNTAAAKSAAVGKGAVAGKSTRSGKSG